VPHRLKMSIIFLLFISLLVPTAQSVRFGRLLFASPTTHHRTHPLRRRPTVSSAAASDPGDLPTNFEFICRDPPVASPFLRDVQWMDISSDGLPPDDGAPPQRWQRTMPLYPLPCVHLPDRTSTATLVNLELRNIRMALDLDAPDRRAPPLFCAVLVAADSGRIAKVGTILRAVNVDVQYQTGCGGIGHDGIHDVRRAVVTAVPEGLTTVQKIRNPEAWEGSRSSYLLAEVEEGDCGEGINSVMTPTGGEGFAAWIYGQVRSIYVAEAERGDGGGPDPLLPPAAARSIREELRPLLPEDFGPGKFWSAASLFQSLCHTFREGRVATLRADVDEKLVKSALSKGGGLRLPIRLRDVDEKTRRDIRLMQESEARDYIATGMDPALNFQAIISAKGHLERLDTLTQIMCSELQRLQKKGYSIDVSGE